MLAFSKEIKYWKCSNVVIIITPPFVFNSNHRGLSCHKCKKTFCHHNILANFHIKSLPILPIVMGGGADVQSNYYKQTMCNQVTFIFSKEWHGTVLSMHLSKLHQKMRNWGLKIKNYIYCLKIISTAKQLICILYTCFLNMQTTKTSST